MDDDKFDGNPDEEYESPDEELEDDDEGELVETDLEEDEDYYYDPAPAELYRIIPESELNGEEAESKADTAEPGEDEEPAEAEGDTPKVVNIDFTAMKKREQAEAIAIVNGEEPEPEEPAVLPGPEDEEAEETESEDKPEGATLDEMFNKLAVGDDAEDDYPEDDEDEELEDDDDEDYNDGIKVVSIANGRAQILDIGDASLPEDEEKNEEGESKHFLKSHIRDIIAYMLVVILIGGAVFAAVKFRKYDEAREAEKNKNGSSTEMIATDPDATPDNAESASE